MTGCRTLFLILAAGSAADSPIQRTAFVGLHHAPCTKPVVSARTASVSGPHSAATAWSSGSRRATRTRW